MRLIDVDELIKTVNEDPFVLDGVKCYVRISAMKQPMIDAVEVVRCKDCKYAEENWNGKDIYCLRTSSFPWSNDSFCSDGERKDGDPDE